MIYIITPAYKRAVDYLRNEYPEINPNGNEVIIVTTSARDNVQRLRGRRFTEEDTLIWIGGWIEYSAAIDTEEEIDRMRLFSNPGREIRYNG